MAVLDISEYAELACDVNGHMIEAGLEPALTVQQVTVDVSSAQSAQFNAKTRVVRVHTDVPCRILFGADPTVTENNGKRLAAGQTEYFGVNGQPMKVAVIQTS